jgi:hypothetical protein
MHANWTFARRPPWKRGDVPAMLRWAAAHLKEDGVKSDPHDPLVRDLRRRKLELECRRLLAVAQQAETALDRERSTLLLASEVENEWASIGTLIRSAFENSSSKIVSLSLAHGMPQESAAEFGHQVDEVIRSVLRQLSKNERRKEDHDDEE